MAKIRAVLAIFLAKIDKVPVVMRLRQGTLWSYTQSFALGRATRLHLMS